MIGTIIFNLGLQIFPTKSNTPIKLEAELRFYFNIINEGRVGSTPYSVLRTHTTPHWRSMENEKNRRTKYAPYLPYEFYSLQ